MKLSLHSEAEKYFNDKVSELVDKIRKYDNPKSDQNDFKPQMNATLIKSEDIIGNIDLNLTDVYGNLTAKIFLMDNERYGLFGNAFKDFYKLTEKIQHRKELCEYVSLANIQEIAFEWIKSKYKKESDCLFSEFLLDSLNRSINKYEIWIPIDNLHIQSPIQLGHITLRPIDKNKIAEWIQLLNQNTDMNFLDQANIQAKIKKDYLGLAAGVYKGYSDKKLAENKAYRFTDQAISLLTFYNPACFDMGLTSIVDFRGALKFKSYKAFILKNNKNPSILGKITSTGMHAMTLDNQLIANLKERGLDKINKILISESKNAFETKLIESITLMSKAAKSYDKSSRIIYVFAAIEGLLIKDKSEPITQNLAERIAFFLKDNLDERKEVIGTVKKAYELRSKFIHHSGSIDDIGTLRKFVKYVWHTILLIIVDPNIHGSSVEFINKLDEAKLSGKRYSFK